jgi:hypothetical protein
VAKQSPLFEVLPALLLPIAGNGKGRWLDVDKATKLVKGSDAADRRGIYVFCSIGHGGRLVPWYVGKATKGFAQEVLTSHKLAKLHEAVGRAGSKPLCLYLIALPPNPGKPNSTAITRLETYLIQQCSLLNSDLLNKQNANVYVHRIKGVMNSPPGQPTKAARAIRDMLE